MIKHVSQKKNTFVQSYSVMTLFMHIAFFYGRLVLFILIKERIHSVKLLNEDKIIKMSYNIAYAIQTNLFQLFFIAKCLIGNNHFEYLLSSAIMFHNTILNITLLVIVYNNTFLSIILYTIMIILSYILELAITAIKIYNQKANRDFEIFKKLGLNPEINEAYKIIQILKAIETIDLFVSFMIIGRFLLPGVDSDSVLDLTVFLLLLISIIQHILINFSTDRTKSRKIAIWLTVLKGLMLIGEIIARSIGNYGNLEFTKNVKIILFSDLLLTSCFFIYYLQTSLKYVNCGLKERLSFTTRKISLN